MIHRIEFNKDGTKKETWFSEIGGKLTQQGTTLGFGSDASLVMDHFLDQRGREWHMHQGEKEPALVDTIDLFSRGFVKATLCSKCHHGARHAAAGER